jgi:hypothetical protein
MTMIRFLCDPKKHISYRLRDGRKYIIDSYKDGILKFGYYNASPRQKSMWIDIVQSIIQNDFNGNILEASRVLSEIYKKPEYHRTKLYSLLPMLGGGRKDKKKRKLEKMVKRIIDEKQEEEFFRIYRKMKCAGQCTEKLGTEQCDYQLRTVTLEGDMQSS